MSKKYLDYFPKPLLEDLEQGRWIPIVGAGLSRNAIVPGNQKMPLWKELGDSFATNLSGYTSDNPVDAISAYDSRFGRAKLVEKLTEFLLVDSAKPGAVHESFCRIGFDVVCTTNLDLLLERQYESIARYCRPITDDEHLSIGVKRRKAEQYPTVDLLKLHGDVHHSGSLVVTEEDYEAFLHRHALKATYLANLLISRTAVLIGYSLDDPDIRQIWRVITDRLGHLRRPAYAISVGHSSTNIARFQRRRVQLIELPGKERDYARILADAFNELREFWKLVPLESVSSDRESVSELALPSDATTRICLFLVPSELKSFYRENVYPIAKNWGFVPLAPEDVMAAGDAVSAKIDALTSRAEIIVADIPTLNAVAGIFNEMRDLKGKQIVTVIPDPIVEPVVNTINQLFPEAMRHSSWRVIRPKNVVKESAAFLESINGTLQGIADATKGRLEEEPERLLKNGLYRAAVISAMSLLEVRLRDRIQMGVSDPRKNYNMLSLLGMAVERQVLPAHNWDRLRRWVRERNVAVHEGRDVSPKLAKEIVQGVRNILNKMPA